MTKAPATMDSSSAHLNSEFVRLQYAPSEGSLIWGSVGHAFKKYSTQSTSLWTWSGYDTSLFQGGWSQS